MSCSSINNTTATATYGTPPTWPTDWSAPYSPSGNNKECLPNQGSGFTRSASGTVNPSDITAHVNVLLNYTYPVNVPATSAYSAITGNRTPTVPSLTPGSNNFPQGDINPATAFAQSAAALRTNLENEYCYYYNRYYSLLTFILTVASQASSSTSLTGAASGSTQATSCPAPSSATNYQKAVCAAQSINNKLNDILSILQALVISRNTSLSGYYGTTTGVNQVNGELETIRTQLNNHSKTLSNTQLEGDVQNSMMQYTIEKNQSSRNLLAIYGFMNIVAIGMLFYMYRNTK